jgi:AcrR family transcriptional regulator
VLDLRARPLYEDCSYFSTRVWSRSGPLAQRQQAIDLKRRKPRQARAVDTVETIFEAAARILQTEGRAGFNTNRVAEVAGISIGTLYSYFPDKEAILLAMARRENQAVGDAVARALTDELQTSDELPVRLAVRALIKGYGRRNKARRILMETLIASGGSDEIARPAQAIATLISARQSSLLPANARELSPIALFVLTRAVDSVVRAATYEDAKFIGSREFEDELTRMVMGYLTAA